MKKVLSKIVFGLLCMIPVIVQAESGIENFYVNAVLEENGDLTVEEYFYMNGEFNGMEREILFQNEDLYEFHPELEYYGGSKLHNGSGIELEEIRGLPIDENFDFSRVEGTLFEEVTSAGIGDYGVYTVDSDTDGDTYMIYLPDNKQEAFYIKYTLKNMAVVHEDVGELFWNVMGDTLSESIGTLKVKITFPNNNNEFRVWAHGPLNGVIRKTSNQVLEAEVENVRSYQAVDMRAVFDKSVIPNSSKLTHVNALDKILNFEENQANQANYERAQEEYQNQEKAYEEIEYCEKYPSRSCYNRAHEYVLRVTDEEVLTDLGKKLSDLKEIVTEQEETDAKTYTEYAVEDPDYYWYSSAMEAVSILENEELKNSLLEQLVPVREALEKEETTKNNIAITISIMATIIIIGGCIVVYLKCDKEEKVDFPHKYMRDFPDDFSPSTVEYLFKKKITENSVSAEILYLIYKKVIKAEEDKERKDIHLTKNGLNMENLNDKEQAILDFLFGSSSSIYLKTLKKKAKTSNGRTFLKKWEKMNTKMENEALAEKLFVGEHQNVEKKKTTSNPVIPFVAVMLLMIFLSFLGPVAFLLFIVFCIFWARRTKKNGVSENKKSIEYRTKNITRIIAIVILIFSSIGLIYLGVTNHFVYNAIPFFVVTIISAIVLLIYTFIARKRTTKGATEYVRWVAFKRFLKDFGRMDEKELPEVALWEKYLVYAVVLGCAKKLSKTMKIKMETMNIDSSITFDPYTFTHFAVISHAVSSSVHSAHAASSVSSSGGSSWSSGSGGGGGFSGGGGAGGGGGGGGRF